MRSIYFVISLTTLVVSVSISSATNSDFLMKSLNECIEANSWITCLKQQVLSYLDEQLGITTTTEARSLDSMNEALVIKGVKYFKSFDYTIDLPFVDANFKYRPSRSLADLDIEFKYNKVATNQARGILKKKLLLPFLLLLKLKLKALMPIFVAIIGLKAMKALILSKLAIIFVVGFIALQFFKKGGMMPPMGMMMESAPAPAPVPVPGTYGAPPVPSTTSGYEPINTWDNSGPYSRVWSPSNGLEAQNFAYNYYSPSSSSSSSSSSLGSYSPSSLSPSSSLSSSSSASSNSVNSSNY